MFNFRIINTADGNQIIDSTLNTTYEMLSPPEMVEYIEMDCQLAFIERLNKKQKKETCKRKNIHNPFIKVVVSFVS